VKGERPELVVQKLTELGVDRVVPFVAGRSVVRWEPGLAVMIATIGGNSWTRSDCRGPIAVP
jgi:16S rRNA U1498 N3-methylase RsmE